jgi:hypothetical protein
MHTNPMLSCSRMASRWVMWRSNRRKRSAIGDHIWRISRHYQAWPRITLVCTYGIHELHTSVPCIMVFGKQRLEPNLSTLILLVNKEWSSDAGRDLKIEVVVYDSTFTLLWLLFNCPPSRGRSTLLQQPSIHLT